jgi:hypothetical protein
LLTISFVTFAVTHVLWAWQRGEAPRARTAAAAALRRAPGLVLAWVLVHVAEAAALAAFGVPYLIVAPLLLCTVPVMAVEGRSALSAMGRSWRLGLRELGLVLGGFLLIATVGVVLLVALSGVSYATDAIFDALGWSGSFLVDVAVSFATSMVLVPFAAGSVALVYFDLRVRREGLDLELAADRHFDAA